MWKCGNCFSILINCQKIVHAINFDYSWKHLDHAKQERERDGLSVYLYSMCAFMYVCMFILETQSLQSRVHYRGDNKMFSFSLSRNFFWCKLFASAYKLNVTLHSSMQTSTLHTHTLTHTRTHLYVSILGCQLFWEPNAIWRIFGCLPVPNRKTLHIFHFNIHEDCTASLSPMHIGIAVLVDTFDMQKIWRDSCFLLHLLARNFSQEARMHFEVYQIAGTRHAAGILRR